MAIRLLPFRQYDENDVINLFSTTAANSSPSDTDADAGSLVKVSAKDMDAAPVDLAANSTLLGPSDYPHVARNYYPTVPLKVTEVTAKGDVPIGITLAQTLTHDENGENLLRYPQKKAELYAVTSGEAVPIATKGVFTFSADAFENTPLVTHVYAEVSDNDDGKMKAVTSLTADATKVGTILGVGSRTSQNGNPDQFEGVYTVVKLDL